MLPAVQAAREAARRMQCTNRLKQVGLAIHNFHDTYNAIPPSVVCGISGTGDRRTNMWGILYPFMEQISLYEALSNQYTYSAGGFVVINNWWNTKLNEEQRKSFGSFSGYQCPTRRNGYSANENAADNNNNNDDADAAGPQGDYAFICSSSAGAWYNLTDSTVKDMHSPFRAAISTAPSVAGGQLVWSGRDTFAWVLDGLSNQFFVGEKHIPIGRVGVCPNSAYLSSDAKSSRELGDCSYLRWGSKARSPAGMRTLSSYENYTVAGLTTGQINSFPICRPQDYAQNDNPVQTPFHTALRAIGFGSWHPGVCNFLLGDGSVRPVAVTTPAEPILRAYSFVDDGEAVTLP